MKNRTRKVDELGRIVLPIEFREKLKIKANNNLYMFVENNKIILVKGQEVNELGFITIPLHIRKTLGIKEKDKLSIELVENQIILQKK